MRKTTPTLQETRLIRLFSLLGITGVLAMLQVASILLLNPLVAYSREVQIVIQLCITLFVFLTVLAIWIVILRPIEVVTAMESTESQEVSERFKLFISNVFGYVFEVDAKGTVISISDNYLRDFHFQKEDVIGKTMVSHIPPNQRAQALKNFASILKGRAQPTLRLKIVDGNGEIRSILANASLLNIGSGGVRVVGVLREVSNSENTREELDETKLKYDALVSQSNLLFYDYNVLTGAITWDGAVKKLIGWSKKEFDKLGIDNWANSIHPHDRGRALAELEQAQSAVSNYAIEYRFRTKDGHYRHFRDQGIFIAGRSGKATRMLGTMIDITGLKMTENELRRSKEQFEHSFKTSAIGFAIVGLNGDWVEVNKSLCDLLGYKEAELLQTNFQKLTYPDDLKTDLKLVEQLLRDEISSYKLEKRYVRKDGTFVWGLLSVTLVRDDNNEPLYFVSQIVDISEAKRHSDRMQELNELKTTFIRTVSHQLRTPLNAIKWHMENLLEDEDKFSLNHVENIAQSLEADESAIHIIGDMVTVMDIEEGNVKLKKRQTSLNSLIEKIVTDAKERAKIANIRMRFYRPTKDIKLSVDPSKLTDAIEQVTRNAIHYTKEDGSVSISLKDNKDVVEIRVKDTGIGIPKGDQPKIFQRYYRASNATKMLASASGSGLSIARAYIRLHGGDITFTSKLHKGSTFTITLPKVKKG